MYFSLYLCALFGTILLTSHIASGQGGPCRGAPQRCFPTDRVKASTCITTAGNGSGTNWYQMEDMCKQHNGRLVWLRDHIDIDHLLYTTVHGMHGAFVALGLLSSPADNVGAFWRNPNDYYPLECCTTDNHVCLSNSTEETCTAVGCCWKNGSCQYPHKQSVPTFNLNQTQLKQSGSTERQCIGFQLNANTSTHGHWEYYDCSKPIDNAVYVCEYKCNTDHWPKMNVTDFMHVGPTTSMPITTTTTTTTIAPKSPVTTTAASTSTTQAPVSTSSPQAGNNVNCNKNSNTNVSGTHGNGTQKDSLLKVLLSLETGGAMTNMSFSLQQKSP